MTKKKLASPRTDTARTFLGHLPDSESFDLRSVNKGELADLFARIEREAEARQQDGSALRLAEALHAEYRYEGHRGSIEDIPAIDCGTCQSMVRAVLAALPASAPDIDLETWMPPRPDFSKPPAPGNAVTDREDVKGLGAHDR